MTPSAIREQLQDSQLAMNQWQQLRALQRPNVLHEPPPQPDIREWPKPAPPSSTPIHPRPAWVKYLVALLTAVLAPVILHIVGAITAEVAGQIMGEAVGTLVAAGLAGIGKH